MGGIQSFNSGNPYGAAENITKEPYVPQGLPYANAPAEVPHFFTDPDAFRTEGAFSTDLHVTFIGTEFAAASAILGGPTGPGGLVIRLDPGPALKAGMHAGDVITRIGQTPIAAEDDLRASLRKLGPGVSRFTVKRGEKEQVLEIECPGCRVEQ